MHRSSHLTLTSEPYVSDLPKTWWLARALDLELAESVSAAWATSVHEPGPDADGLVVRRRRRAPSADSFAGELGEALVFVEIHRGKLEAEVAGRTRAQVEAALEALRGIFPRQEVDESSGRIPVAFWHRTEYDEDGERRTVQMPSWDDVAGNYAAAPRAELERLVGMSAPGDAGRLILWHGPPGTGKTYAVRALAWEWRDWCRLHYVMDPEALLGSGPRYLLDVISAGKDDDDPDWRLIAMEDTGELLVPDARERTGQGLSRLLNASDGLMGQGLNVLFLITTNEPLSRIHPAVARPGRCAAQVEFAPLGEGEARAWLARRGRPELVADVHGATTIAELHALLAGHPTRPETEVGFRA